MCEPADPNACVFSVPDKEKYMFFITYRGRPTDQLSKSFKKLNLPCRVIMKTQKTKTVLPSLKPMVPKMLRSDVVYKIECPRCNSSYVGQTSRHMQQRYREHFGKNKLPKKHFDSCEIAPTYDCVSILGHSKTDAKLLTPEALFIKKLKPSLNTKDEYRSRTLTLKF